MERRLIVVWAFCLLLAHVPACAQETNALHPLTTLPAGQLTDTTHTNNTDTAPLATTRQHALVVQGLQALLTFVRQRGVQSVDKCDAMFALWAVSWGGGLLGVTMILRSFFTKAVRHSFVWETSLIWLFFVGAILFTTSCMQGNQPLNDVAAFLLFAPSVLLLPATIASIVYAFTG
eukprot:c8694_g1_i1.p2 GENE.c8694_g1_i1~~c8694_g1_i1.p2  ORF type:complete len:176 (-),score=58.01 c8694_g1_i1:100-627(-)